MCSKNSIVAVMDEARALALELLGLTGKGYQALFLSGGASLEFLMVPYNLMKENGKVAYLDSGTWASAAIKEAKFFGEMLFFSDVFNTFISCFNIFVFFTSLSMISEILLSLCLTCTTASKLFINSSAI